MKKRTKLLSLISVILMLTFILNPATSYADGSDAFDFDAEGLEALNKSIYVNSVTRTAHVDKEKALTYYSFTDEELNAVQYELDKLTDSEIQEMINYTLDSDGEGQARSVSVVVWVGLAAVILGIIASTAVYFSSKYMTYKEKQNLVNRCYDMGGTPVLDSGDTSDIGAAPEKAWWKISNTYTFQCVTS